MNTLRQRMWEDMHIRNLSLTTQKKYLPRPRIKHLMYCCFCLEMSCIRNLKTLQTLLEQNVDLSCQLFYPERK